MATSWLTLNPTTGSGNGTIAVGGSEHTGRVARQGTFQVTGVGVSSPVTVNVTQSAKAEFVTIDGGATKSVAKAGGNVTITGKTNSSKLTFAWVGNAQDKDGNEVDAESGINYPEVTLPTKYSADGVQTSNGVAIADDPGADAEFAFSITLSYPNNATLDVVYRTLKVTAAGGQSAQVQTQQAAGSATLSVSPTEITIPQSGTAQNVTVTSNTTWTVG